MSDSIETGPLSSNPVEGAIAAGKIPESRRERYNAQYAQDPEGTTRLLDSLAAVLPPRALPRAEAHARRIGVSAMEVVDESSWYPPEWLGDLPDPNDRIIRVDD